ncbi:3-methyl-2-oxobutanoate dehydrogenase subunit VorB [Eubacteriales bacterium OttesenSCG-928-K08]|nr:3-methyl-2-oxobutanoate dehydrogenase subunit VorB [Eubacteriales bacterium OttesenSCG-928-K08]
MSRIFLKGCEAIAEAAVRSGCRFFAGYPITPQNEIPEYLSRRLPEVGGTFVQGESEVASVNMVYGAAQTGTRAMTSSSSCGISLKSEAISFCASARIPMVYANIARGGPGIGSIHPAQQDYMQATKASGNGGFRMMVFAPATVQEAVDMTYAAFDYAQRDRNPVLILADGVLGTIMEPVVLPELRSEQEVKALKDAQRDWALVGHNPADGRAFIKPGRWSTLDQEQACKDNEALYASWENDVQVEEYLVDDAQYIITAYGISGRIAKSAVNKLRAEGILVGLIRPKTVSPFPYGAIEQLDYSRVKAILDVEMSIPAQMVFDVKLAVKDRCPIHTCLRSGGEIMSREKIVEAVRALAQ